MSGYHILFIPSWYPDRNGHTHGIFNRAFVEAIALRSQVSVLYVSADKNVSNMEVTTSIEQNIFSVTVYYPARSGSSWIERIRQFVRRRRAYEHGFRIIRSKMGMPSLIQLNVVFPAGSAALKLRKTHRLPLVVNECWTGFDPEDRRYQSSFFLKRFTKRVLSKSQVIMPVSAYLKTLMISHGLTGHYKVVHNIVDLRIFFPIVEQKPTSFRLIHVSALDDDQKNVSGIIGAFAKAKATLPQLELVIVGSGPDLQALRKKAATLVPGGGIMFKGQLIPADVAAEINKADALVMFSNYETFCVAVPEALACGVPVITSDAGGVMSYFNEKFGYVIPKRDTEALCAAMISFYQTPRSFDRHELRGFVEDRFSPGRISEALHDVYRSVLDP